MSRQHHAGDVQEKNRLARMLDNKFIFQQRIVNCRETEYNRLKKEREDKINQLVAMRKCVREFKRKLLFYLKSEDERLTRLREEEEARKHEEEERQKKEETEKRESEKERQRREGLLRRPVEPLSRSTDPASGTHAFELPMPAAPAAAKAAAPRLGKYVSGFLRERNEGQRAMHPKSDRWWKQDDCPPQTSDRW